MKKLLCKKKYKIIKLLLEPIENDNIIIDYYVIHMENSLERKENINLMQNKLQKHINIFNAIDGNNIKNINDYDSEINYTMKTINKNIIGCYLSHYLLIKQLINNNINNDYTVIFEDDFNINYDNLDGIIKNIISQVSDFDIIFLGALNSHIKLNLKLYNNIYITNHVLWGTHALLFNNKSLQKIFNELKNITTVIDYKYSEFYKLNNFKILNIYPNLVSQNLNFKSLIGNHFV